MTSFIATNSRLGGAFLYNDRRRLMISEARVPASMILSVPLRTSVSFGRVALKPSQRCLGMSGCDLNGLCEFVRDGGNQFSHRADPARMCKIGLELFGTFAIFNVGRRTIPFHDLSSLVPQQARRGVKNQR